jgi:anti-sigma factor RsiW
MQCHEASEWMSLQLDGLLSPEEAMRLQQHLERCSDCWLEWRQLQAASALFEQAAIEPAPAEFTAQVMARVRRRSRWLSLVRGGTLILLGLSILLAIGWAPLAALTGLFAESPAALRALVSVVATAANIGGTLASACMLVLERLLSGYCGLIFVGCVLLIGVLAIPWVTLVTRASRVRMRVSL